MIRITYAEALEYIHTAHRSAVKHGLDNIRNLLNLLGNPHRNLSVIHIAGTNGKGSVASMIASMLHAQGYKTGLYTSPYVTRFNERIRIDGTEIADDQLAALTEEVKRAIDTISDPWIRPTEFQVITAIAFLYFYRQKCDYVILETGMGGRLDPTNIVENTLCSVITSIGYDHMNRLGNTLPQIAFEKCGIIKQNGVVVTYPAQKSEVLDVILRECEKKGARLIIADMPIDIKSTASGNEFNYASFGRVKISLTGTYQPYNAATALAVVQALRKYTDVQLSDEAVYRGMLNASWPGRFEILSERPVIIVDGAHNIDGMARFSSSIVHMYQNKPITLVFGMMRDKQYKDCARLISPIAKHVITTTVPSPRSASAEELAESCSGAENVIVCPIPKKAAELALELTGIDGIIAVIGSLYLVGELRQYLIDKLKTSV